MAEETADLLVESAEVRRRSHGCFSNRIRTACRVCGEAQRFWCVDCTERRRFSNRNWRLMAAAMWIEAKDKQDSPRWDLNRDLGDGYGQPMLKTAP